MVLVPGLRVTAESVGMMKYIIEGLNTADTPFRGVRIYTGASTSRIM